MDIDLLNVKNWIMGAIKRAAARTEINANEVNEAFEIIADLDRAMAGCNFAYASILIPATGLNVNISQAVYDEIQALIYDGRKIAAIKLMRSSSGIGLKNAKDSVEDDRNWDWSRNPPINYANH